MKKIALAFTALTLVLTSCSSSSDSNTTPAATPGNTLFKTISTDQDGFSDTTVFTYDGSKLVKTTTNMFDVNNYTYVGNLITRIDYYFGSQLQKHETFAYDGTGKLTMYTQIIDSDSEGYKQVYTYNSNGSISFSKYSGNTTSQTNLQSTGVISFQNGDIIKSTSVTNAGTQTIDYTYDSKNSAYKNITGFGLISFVSENEEGIIHNVSSRVSNILDNKNYHSTFNYNINDYPSTATIAEDIDTYQVQFFYQ